MIMNNILTIILLMLIGALPLGCGQSFVKDPLINKPSPIQNGQIPDNKIKEPTNTPSDAIKIDSSDIVSFMEEREDKVEIKFRILQPQYEGQLFIDNFDDFPGAKFDSQSGEFIWTPPKGLVTEGFSRQMEIIVSAIAKSTELEDQQAPILMAQKRIILLLNRKLSLPEIKKVDGVPPQMREGDSRVIYVHIVDPDAGSTLKEEPHLVVEAFDRDTKSLAPFISILEITPDSAKREWKYKLKIDLEKAEITRSSELFGVNIQVINHFGKVSSLYPIGFRIFTKLNKPNTTWRNGYEFYIGEEGRVSFLIFDPGQEGEVSLKGLPLIPQGSTLNCLRASLGVASCEFKWNPSYQFIGKSQHIKLDIQTKSTDYRDTYIESSSVDLKLIVKKKELPGEPPENRPDPHPNPHPILGENSVIEKGI
jgi:hypothetical protein